MAFDCFLKLEGIEGESLDQNHKGEIELLSINWGATQSGTSGYGGGSGGGRGRRRRNSRASGRG